MVRIWKAANPYHLELVSKIDVSKLVTAPEEPAPPTIAELTRHPTASRIKNKLSVTHIDFVLEEKMLVVGLAFGCVVALRLSLGDNFEAGSMSPHSGVETKSVSTPVAPPSPQVPAVDSVSR